MMTVLEKWEYGCRHWRISCNTFNSSYQGSLKVWQPKWAGLQDLQTRKGQKTIQGKNSIQCTGGGTIKIAPSIYVEIGHSTKIVLRFLFVLNSCYFPPKKPVHCSHPNKGNCMVSWLNTASLSQCHLGRPWRLERVYPMYHIEWGSVRHMSQAGWIFCPVWIPLRNDYTGLGIRGGEH